MKRSLFFTLLFACSVLSAQTVTNADANQVGKAIEITYDLDRTADISVDYSTDGGRTYTTLRHVSGDVGTSISPGHKTITWDVLAEQDNLIGDKICFRVNATTDHGTENGHEWVDLGLSVKWATCNVGTNKPEEYGNYYAWGETSPKSSYTPSNYTYSSNPTTLPLNRDAVAVNWGGNWRMPTLNEIKELKEKCKWTWTGRGYTVTGPNGNAIFFPAAGFRFNGDLYYAGSYGYYWSSSLSSDNSDYAYGLGFDSGNVGWSNDGYDRYCGLSVRGVFSK